MEYPEVVEDDWVPSPEEIGDLLDENTDITERQIAQMCSMTLNQVMRKIQCDD